MERFATREDFEKLDDKYFVGRWGYMSAVIDVMRGIEFESCLELGTNGFRLVKDSDTMDIKPYPGLTYQHDAREPFPIPDQQYDLFVALQVWEHLQGGQQDAFREVVRVSRKAILSFPYLWHSPHSPHHHGLTHRVFQEWTLGVRPVRRFLVPRSGRLRDHVLPVWVPDRLVRDARTTVVYVFDFERS
ncbi:hypothetical protein [Anaerosoma tenue]|uniref:hypothetical protein n=1 Tax=Anaerosoma tenue TaxID=2933588 RepID=UPI002260FD34|nr:hypothetical protein [Anaerosoma tenue]MCK8114691.1 hypothetical protein [Anaerosoma tenue]